VIGEDERMRVEIEVGMPVAPAEVWSTLLAWERQPSWMPDANRVDVVSQQRSGVGTTIAVRTRVLRVPLFTDRLEVVAWEPPRRVVVAHRRFVFGTGEWAVEAAGSGCRFRWTEDVSLPAPWLGELVLWIYRPFLRRLMRTAAWNLRAVIEEAAVSDQTSSDST
jgi:polyketide cyclase/dehydrase/lipid transport protein